MFDDVSLRARKALPEELQHGRTYEELGASAYRRRQPRFMSNMKDTTANPAVRCRLP